jgi:apolipoprotein N-acyltransferase
MPFAEQVEHYRVYERLTMQAAGEKPDLIVWPASSIAAPITDRLARFTLTRLAKASGTYLLVGGSGHRKDRPRNEGDLPYSNSEFLFSPVGRLEGKYNKIHLLPFNEYVPLRGRIRLPAWITKIKDSFIRGTEYTVFRVPGCSFSTPICWENMFPDMTRRFVLDGAQFIAAVTNEAFFRDGTALHRQTLAMNVFRAVENRVAVARASPTGISAIINPDGRVEARVRGANGKDLNVAGVLVRDIPLAAKKTFYTLYGDLFAWFAIVAAIGIIIASTAAEASGRFREKSRG